MKSCLLYTRKMLRAVSTSRLAAVIKEKRRESHKWWSWVLAHTCADHITSLYRLCSGHLLQVLGRGAVHSDGVLEVAAVGAAHRHGAPHKARVVGELQPQLGGAAQTRQEDVLQVYEGGAEVINKLQKIKKGF